MGGDKSSEWDHLRPLVVNRRPTGFVSEIANLVPACGKCNQSKGNKHWLKWIMSDAPHAPARRGVEGLTQRVERLKAYEGWRDVRPVGFEQIVGKDAWDDYWQRLESAVGMLRQCQEVAVQLRSKIAAARDAKGCEGHRQRPE